VRLAKIRAALFLAVSPIVGTWAAEETPSVPTYTNDDLRRVSPRRGETGVLSKPAVPPGAGNATPAARRPRGEDYWRAEAERLHDRLRSLRQRSDDLRLLIEQRERQQRRQQATARRSPTAAPDSTEVLRRRLLSLEAEIRDRESRFEERARREGALPGWLR